MVFRMDPAAKARIRAEAQRVRAQVLDEIAEDARRDAPVDTGELAGSITVDRAAGTVTANAPHAAFVEQGTEHMRAQPFLRPATYTRRRVR